MAKFAKNDWVRVIPTPDTMSDVWTSSHNKYCGKIGRIIDVNDSYHNMILIRVAVHFSYKLSSISGEHSAWFEDKHVIKTSKWENDREIYLSDKFEEYKKFEISIKKKRDKILKEIFTDPYENERKKKLEESKKAIEEMKKIEEEKEMDGWVMGDGWFVKDFDDI